jgi:hypothetical protein
MEELYEQECDEDSEKIFFKIDNKPEKPVVYEKNTIWAC